MQAPCQQWFRQDRERPGPRPVHDGSTVVHDRPALVADKPRLVRLGPRLVRQGPPLVRHGPDPIRQEPRLAGPGPRLVARRPMLVGHGLRCFRHGPWPVEHRPGCGHDDDDYGRNGRNVLVQQICRIINEGHEGGGAGFKPAVAQASRLPGLDLNPEQLSLNGAD